MVFFIGGYETTASAINYTLYELTINGNIQTRLHQELSSALAGLDENSDEYYDKVMGDIPYLDAVVKESLRKNPAVIRLERRLNGESYKIDGISLKNGQIVEVSIYGVHYNPEYYPDPHRFNPDRFMPENRHLLVPGTYLPFGIGPRNCIGMRFAHQEIKLCLSRIVRQFQFLPTPQTPTKPEFETFRFALALKSYPTKIRVR